MEKKILNQENLYQTPAFSSQSQFSGNSACSTNVELLQFVLFIFMSNVEAGGLQWSWIQRQHSLEVSAGKFVLYNYTSTWRQKQILREYIW